MIWAVNPVDELSSFNWLPRRDVDGIHRTKGHAVRTRMATEPPRRRGAQGRTDARRLRAGVFRIGALAGLETQAVVRFSEAISGKRWRRCRRYELEQVAANLAEISGRIRENLKSGVTSV